jgi:hypothetical protein
MKVCTVVSHADTVKETANCPQIIPISCGPPSPQISSGKNTAPGIQPRKLT